MNASESYHSYPKVYALGHSAIKELLFDEVTVEEKVDGSQFSFGRFGGEFRCRSKGVKMIPDAPEAMFQEAVKVAQNLDLHDGWTYRAEYLKTPKHNTIAYSRIPKNHLILFDINPGEEAYLSYNQKAEEATRIGLELVPLMFVGKLDDPSQIGEFLTRESVLGGQKVEGVVIKNYSRFGMDKKVLMGKYVSEEFKEIHGEEWKRNNPTKTDIIAQLIASYRTPARWEKAVQHLKEKGQLTNTPQDIGKLIKEVQRDLLEEEKEEIKTRLYISVVDQIKRGVVGGLPEYYKEKLMSLQFLTGEELTLKEPG